MKRILLAILVLLCLPDYFGAQQFLPNRRKAFQPVGGGGGSVAVVQNVSGTVTGGNLTLNLSGVVAGNLLVVSAANETDSGAVPADMTVSGGSLTWTKRVDAQAASSGDAEIWTAVFSAGGSITITVAGGGAGVNLSGVAYEMSGSDNMAAGFGTGSATAQGQPSITVTTTRANSIVICVSSDWNAVSGTATYRSTPITETKDHYVSGRYHGYHYYKAASTATSYTLGMTAPTGQAAGTVGLEIRTP